MVLVGGPDHSSIIYFALSQSAVSIYLSFTFDSNPHQDPPISDTTRGVLREVHESLRETRYM